MEHDREIIDQFTRQAQQFAQSPSARNEEILEQILRMTQPQAGDAALDVACGPGVLACAMARRVGHVTGIDLTPAMLDQARETQREQGIENLTWEQGDVTALPHDDASFDIVTCRFAFHHFPEPRTVLHEMRRVCRKSGRIVVADIAPAANKADALNALERLRDASHVRALPVGELSDLFLAEGLGEPYVERIRLGLELDAFLARSYPSEGSEARIQEMFERALGDDFLDLQPRREQGRILFSAPIAILSAQVSDGH